jgi:hypothetical protein
MVKKVNINQSQATKAGIIASAIVVPLATYFPLRTYADLWVNFIGLPQVYLGYIFLFIAVLAAAGYAMSKSGNVKVNLIFLAGCSLAIALQIVVFIDLLKLAFFSILMVKKKTLVTGEGKIPLSTLMLIIFSALGPIFTILFPMNLWMQIWTSIFNLPLSTLGYVFIGVAFAFVIAYFKVKSARAKLNFAFVIALAILVAIVILFAPNWFYFVFVS